LAQGPLIDKHFLVRLERLAIHWQQSFSGIVGGHNTSRFAGPGQEFLDHRHFHQGDDLRAVNWRAYMRLEKMFLKMFQIEPRVPVRLLVDASASMAATGEEKFLAARRLAAALVYVGLVRLDTMVVHTFTDTLGEARLCSGGRHRFGPVSDYLGAAQAAGRTDFLAVSKQFVERYAQRGLLIVLSDFLTEAGSTKPFDYLAEFGHELLLIQVYDEQDRTPPWTGELELEEAETGERLELDFDGEARERYTAAFDDWSEQLRRSALRHGGRYAAVPASLPVEEAVFGPLVRVQGVR